MAILQRFDRQTLHHRSRALPPVHWAFTTRALRDVPGVSRVTKTRRRGSATDAAAPLDGIIPPMAQHKGRAIAVVTDMRPGTASAIAQRSGNARARKLF